MFLISTYPVTITLVAILMVAGISSGTLARPLAPQLQHRYGYSPDLLSRGKWQRMLTSLFLTADQWKLYTALGMLMLSVGWLEAIEGSLVAGIVFLGIHLVTLLVLAAGVFCLNALSQSVRGQLLWYATDTGPSAGYYGCLGLAVSRLDASIGWQVILAIALVLALRCAWSSYQPADDGQMMSADWSHAIAFPLGLLASTLVAH